jgi:glycosyltransferase involved in cell wall biosynthesis
MIKNICLVTSGQPSANPRLVKEAITLVKEGLNVSVIYCPISPWADNFDISLFKSYPTINWISVGFHSQKEPIRYHISRIRRKCYKFIFRTLGNCMNAAELSMVLYGQELKLAACKNKADLYIGHNLGALPAIVSAALKNGAKAVFDFEDYHRGENETNTIESRAVKILEEKYVPRLAYATAASPLIANAYQIHFNTLPIHVINNYFPRKYASNTLNELSENPLRLFWFSQYVGKNRGLEQVIEAIGKIKKYDIRLTLLGNCCEEIKLYFTDYAAKNQLNANQLRFISPVSEKDIVKIASMHHIGLAVEIPHNQNRQLCLTNKIFMYLLAGNAILFSDTKAQKNFFIAHSEIGAIFSTNNINELVDTLILIRENPNLLNEMRHASFRLGEFLNWENEQKKLFEICMSI